MSVRHISFFVALLLLLFGCGGDQLDLNLQLDASGGLQPEDAVVIRNRIVGRVTGVEAAGQSGYQAKLSIESEFAAEITQSARFVVDEDPDSPGKHRVEIVPGKPDDTPLTDGATVRGTVRQAPFFPFGEIFRSFTEGLGVLRDQVERFESDMRRVPDSEEARKLKDEWARLLSEIQRAQAATEESIKKDLLPKLQEELRQLEDGLQSLEKKPEKTPQSI